MNPLKLLLFSFLLLTVMGVGSYLVLQRVRVVAVGGPPAPGSATTNDPMAAGNLRIGDKMPDIVFQDREGKEHRLAEFLDGEHFVVLTFHHPDCPCAESCARLINEMTNAGYSDVRIVGLMASGYDSERVIKALDQQIGDKLVNFPVYMDRNQVVMKQLGATRTPEIWVLDKDGFIRYYGAPENSLFPGTPGHRYLLREAIDALRQGKAPEIQSKRPIGCPIELPDAA